MDKPDSVKCKQCANTNKLRCSLCKYKTDEWVVKYINSVLVFSDVDNFRQKKEEENEQES